MLNSRRQTSGERQELQTNGPTSPLQVTQQAADLEIRSINSDSIIIDVSQPAREMESNGDCLKTTPIALRDFVDKFSSGTPMGATTWIAYAMTRGRVRVISRLNAEKTILKLPASFPLDAEVVDMAMYHDRIAGVTSDGGLVVWELPESIYEDVPGDLLLVLMAGTDPLRMVKWHPNNINFFAVASESQIYCCHVATMMKMYSRGHPLAPSDLLHPAIVCNLTFVSIHQPLAAFDFDVSGATIVAISEDSILNIWSIRDRRLLRSLNIHGEGLPSSIKALDEAIVIGRKNGTILQLLSGKGNPVLSTVKFVNGTDEDPDMYAHVAWDSRIQTVWVTNNRRKSVFAFRVHLELPDPDNKQTPSVGYFSRVTEFAGIKPTVHFVILNKEQDPDGEAATAACLAAKVPITELALFGFYIHSTGVDQVLISKDAYNAALLTTASSSPHHSLMTGSINSRALHTPPEAGHEKVIRWGSTLQEISANVTSNEVLPPASPAAPVGSWASFKAAIARASSQSGAPKPQSSSGPVASRRASTTTASRASSRSGSSKSRNSSAASWHHYDIAELADTFEEKDVSKLADSLTKGVVVDFDVFLAKMMLERAGPPVKLEFAVNIVLTLANRPVYGFDRSEHGYGSAPLELQLRTLSSGLQLIRTLSVTIDHAAFRVPILNAITNLKERTKTLLFHQNPNISFLFHRIMKDALALKSNRSTLKVVGNIGLAVASAALHLYAKRLPDAIDALTRGGVDIGIAWDALVQFFNNSTLDGTSPLEWNALIADVIKDYSQAKKSPEFVKFLDMKQASYLLTLELLDALQTSQSDDLSPEETHENITSAVWTILAKHMNHANQHHMIVQSKAFEVLLSLQPVESREDGALAMIATAKDKYESILRQAKPMRRKDRTRLLTAWDVRVEEARKYCAQRDRLYDQVIDSYAHATMDLFLIRPAPVFTSGSRKLFECPISGHIMIDAIALKCGHHVSAGAFEALHHTPNSASGPSTSSDNSDATPGLANDVPHPRWRQLPLVSCCREEVQEFAAPLHTLRRLAIQYLVEVADLDELAFWDLLDTAKGAVQVRPRRDKPLEGLNLRLAIHSSRAHIENVLLRHCCLPTN